MEFDDPDELFQAARFRALEYIAEPYGMIIAQLRGRPRPSPRGDFYIEGNEFVFDPRFGVNEVTKQIVIVADRVYAEYARESDALDHLRVPPIREIAQLAETMARWQSRLATERAQRWCPGICWHPEEDPRAIHDLPEALPWDAYYRLLEERLGSAELAGVEEDLAPPEGAPEGGTPQAAVPNVARPGTPPGPAGASSSSPAEPPASPSAAPPSESSGQPPPAVSRDATSSPPAEQPPAPPITGDDGIGAAGPEPPVPPVGRFRPDLCRFDEDPEARVVAVAHVQQEMSASGIGTMPWEERLDVSGPREALGLEDLLDLVMQTGPGNERYSLLPPSNRSQPGTVLGRIQRGYQNVCVVIDSSGTMAGRKDYLETAIGFFEQLSERVTVVDWVTGDVEVHSQGSRDDPIELRGGGGTNMPAVCEQACEEFAPEVMVLFTDGYTPWPRDFPCYTITCLINDAEVAVPDEVWPVVRIHPTTPERNGLDAPPGPAGPHLR